MIISTGMRTDIPAFYSQWFIKRIEEGFVYVRNPYYHNQVIKYTLDPNVVDCITFCTKNPLPLIPYLNKLNLYQQFWFITITPYDKDYEPNVPNKDKIVEGFKQLSKKIGINNISWRYDPIFITKKYTIQKHIQEFSKLCKKLKGYTNTCVISFLDLYDRVKCNTPELNKPSIQQQIELTKAFVHIGKENDITIKSCCEGIHLAKYGIDISGCQTRNIIEKAIGATLNPPRKRNVRMICNCLLGQDIGAYNCCPHLCKYCYANANKKKVMFNIKMHDPNSPFLIGHLLENDKIVNAKQESYIDLQTRLF